MGNIQATEAEEKRKKFIDSGKECNHKYDWLREYMLGMHTGDLICSNCFKVVKYR